MNQVLRKHVITPLLVMMLGGCMSISTTQNQYNTNIPIPANALWTVDIDSKGKPQIAFYDEKKQINVLKSDTDISITPLNDTKFERASSGLSAAKVKGGELIYAFRDKEPERDLFVISSVGDKNLVHGLGAETVPLARFKMLPRGNNIAVIWYGERQTETNKEFQIYYREIDKDGKPYGQAQELFEGIYPTMSITPNGRVTAVSWIKKGEDHFLVSRTLVGKQEFKSTVNVDKIAPITPTLDTVTDAERVFVFWHAQYGEDMTDFRLEGAYSDDGEVWKKFAIPSLNGWDIESAHFSADGYGNIAAVVGALPPKSNKADKIRSYVITSNDRGLTWSDAKELRDDEIQKEKSYSHARSPKVTFIGKDKLLVIWQDWRTLRSAVHYSYSEDAGKSWKVSNRKLTESETENEKILISGEPFAKDNGKLYISTELYNGDKLDSKTIRVRSFSEGAFEKHNNEQEAKTIDKDRLSTRVNQFWAALSQKDFRTAYALQDPFFRARVPYESYQQQMGRIEYSETSFLKADYLGPIALTVTKITVEVVPFKTKEGKIVKMDKDTRFIPSRWLWIDNDWYMEYHQESREIKFTPF